MSSLQKLDYLELLFDENFNLYEKTEVINLPGFTIIASSVVEHLENVTTFLVRKVYGWGSCQSDCSACLFDYYDKPTVGIWQENVLTLYQQQDSRYIRFTYFIENQKAKIYYNLIDISFDGQQWQRCSQGNYRWT